MFFKLLFLNNNNDIIIIICRSIRLLILIFSVSFQKLSYNIIINIQYLLQLVDYKLFIYVSHLFCYHNAISIPIRCRVGSYPHTNSVWALQFYLYSVLHKIYGAHFCSGSARVVAVRGREGAGPGGGWSAISCPARFISLCTLTLVRLHVPVCDVLCCRLWLKLWLIATSEWECGYFWLNNQSAIQILIKTVFFIGAICSK